MTSRCGTGVSDDVNVRSALYYIEALSWSDPPAINGHGVTSLRKARFMDWIEKRVCSWIKLYTVVLGRDMFPNF